MTEVNRVALNESFADISSTNNISVVKHISV